MDALLGARQNASVSRPLHDIDASDLVQRLAATSFALFLDYDGTLTPIAPRPELARLDPRQRDRVRAAAARHPVAIVTGRAMADIRALVGLPGLHYAANHGFEITGPNVAFEVDPELRGLFELVAADLAPRLAGIPGVAFESKGYSVAVHFRLTPDEYVPAIEAAVDAVIATTDGVRKGEGKRVLEIRPAIAWNKGSAVRWLFERFGAAVPLYLGDDRTDEDAFAVVRELGGVGIFVGTAARPTAATHSLPDPEAVGLLLERLAML